MHTPPSVSYLAGRTLFLGVIVGLLIIAGAAVMSLWTWQSQALHWRQVLGWLVWITAAFWLFASWLRAPRGDLTWDGTCWWWEAANSQAGSGSGTLLPRLDVQNNLLLEFSFTDRKCLGLWVTKSSNPQRWMDFRRAVFAMQANQLESVSPDALVTGRAPP
jgi:hypothetical protein